MPERSTGLPISRLAAQARAGRAAVLTSSTTAMRRQARRTAARSARRRDRPVAKTRTARAASMPFPAARARPGAGPATPAAAITSTRTSRKRSDASAAALITGPTYRPGVPNRLDPPDDALAWRHGFPAALDRRTRRMVWKSDGSEMNSGSDDEGSASAVARSSIWRTNNPRFIFASNS